MSYTTEEYTHSDVSNGAITVNIDNMTTTVIANVFGAGGAEATSDGGSGGYIRAKIDITNIETLQVYPGEAGSAPTGGDGYYVGGDGGTDSDSGASSGGGGGSTTILDGSGDELLHADAGGGGQLSLLDLDTNFRTDVGGGGGARGGPGGDPNDGDENIAGEDAQGSGFGGDGGADEQPEGGDGGQEAIDPRVTTLNTNTGGGNDSDGKIILKFLTNKSSVNTTGWHVEITDPNTGRVRTPDVLDLQNAPIFNPGPNQLPRVRLPVPKDDVWLSDAYDGDPEMRVWRDGRRLPIEVLRDVEQLEGATVLVGVGGVELEQRVRREYNDDRRHVEAANLVTNQTSYAADAPEPTGVVIEDQLQRSVDTDAEFADALNLQAADPFVIENGVLRPAQTSFSIEGETDPITTITGNVIYSDGEATGIGSQFASVGDSGIYKFTTEHDIENWTLRWRREVEPESDGDEEVLVPGFEVRVNGTVVEEFSDGAGFIPTSAFDDPGWDIIADSDNENITLSGTNSIEIEITEADLDFSNEPVDDYGELIIDVINIVDDRLSHNFDNTVHQDEGYLDEPKDYVATTTETTNLQSAFSVVGAESNLTINDTSGAQRVQISNDGGSTYLPDDGTDDGTEDNTSSVTVGSFPNTGSTLRQRFRLDGYEPSGPQSATPRLGYAPQEIDAYDLFADISLELLLIEETFDNDLASILTDFAEVAERSWAFVIDDGTPTVRFVENGQRVADFAPEINSRTREKLGKTYDSVTVKGSNEPVSREPYTASTTVSSLVRENILPGSETVVDPATGDNFTRGDDYEIDYQPGEIRATSSGALVAGDEYEVNYQYQPRGTFEQSNAPADPDELVELVPGVTSERLGEQVAFVIADSVQSPRYAAEVTIPDPDPRFDPTEALPPSALSLPADAGDLEVRGEPQLTEEGLAVRFGTRPAVEASVQRLSRQLSRVSDRS